MFARLLKASITHRAPLVINNHNANNITYHLVSRSTLAENAKVWPYKGERGKED